MNKQAAAEHMGTLQHSTPAQSASGSTLSSSLSHMTTAHHSTHRIRRYTDIIRLLIKRLTRHSAAPRLTHLFHEIILNNGLC